MNLAEFNADVEKNLRRLKFHKGVDSILKLISFGIISNRKNIDKYQSKYEESKNDFNKYKALLEKAIELDQTLETIIIEGVRISKHTFSDLPVTGGEDYGIGWDNLREQVLSRDCYECQESNGSCKGPLQIHHILPLSKGGSNELGNLITLCLYHHCLKHWSFRCRCTFSIFTKDISNLPIVLLASFTTKLNLFFETISFNLWLRRYSCVDCCNFDLLSHIFFTSLSYFFSFTKHFFNSTLQ